jgi:hypothetical protein
MLVRAIIQQARLTFMQSLLLKTDVGFLNENDPEVEQPQSAGCLATIRNALGSTPSQTIVTSFGFRD